MVTCLCNDKINTQWNKKNREIDLKLWITSIKQNDKPPSNLSFLRKNLLLKRNSTATRYIGNVNCQNNTISGPVWKSAGRITNHQFHDGFLYG